MASQPYRRPTTTIGYISRVALHRGPNRWLASDHAEWREITETDDGGFFLTSEEAKKHTQAATKARWKNR